MYVPFSAVVRDEYEGREFRVASEPRGREVSRAVEPKAVLRELVFQMLPAQPPVLEKPGGSAE
jgi:hypothetical protein